MTWHPYTEPPQKVGLYRLKDAIGNEFMVRWDGRHFRYASGMLKGGVVVHYKGDLWKAIEGEKQ